jgi:hypothetical protein
MSVAKEEARRLLDDVPTDSSWNDIVYELLLRQKLERAIREADAGNVVPHEEVKKRFRVE